LPGNVSRFGPRTRQLEESNIEIKDNLKFIENLLVDNDEDSTLYTTFSHVGGESFANDVVLNLPEISAINDSRFYFERNGSKSKEFPNSKDTISTKKE